MQWMLTMRDAQTYVVLGLHGDCPVALYKTFDKDHYEAIVFFEDFNGDMNDWSVGDSSSYFGFDYLGVVRTIPQETSYQN